MAGPLIGGKDCTKCWPGNLRDRLSRLVVIRGPVHSSQSGREGSPAVSSADSQTKIIHAQCQLHFIAVHNSPGRSRPLRYGPVERRTAATRQTMKNYCHGYDPPASSTDHNRLVQRTSAVLTGQKRGRNNTAVCVRCDGAVLAHS